MTSTPLAALALCVTGSLLTSPVVQAQNASIAATATVLARPLTMYGAMRSSIAGELLVRLDGCGTGAITIDAQSGTGTRRASRMVLDTRSGCHARTVSLPLPAGRGAVSYLVTLEQTNALISPVFAQVVVPAAGVGPRTSLAY